jgi:predicted negative regulator of RcsB-dependent stress response
VYSGQVAEASAGIERYKQLHGEDALTDFYSGDLKVFENDLAGARIDFERAVERDETGGDQIYQMFAALRLAELHGQDGDFNKAIDKLDDAKKFCHANYLLDFIIRSRKRFYELVKDGKLDAKPALLITEKTANSAE